MLTRQTLSLTTTAYRSTLTHAQASRALQLDEAFRVQLTQAIACHEAVFWECAPSSCATVESPFHFVVVDCPSLARLRPSAAAFRAHLRPPAATFHNLGGDAVLVAPGGAASDHSAHIVDWCRHAPPQEHHGLWKQVGAAMQSWWERGEDPLWVSTSGLGVPWVHVRLDGRPKYITHPPFRDGPHTT